MAVVEVINKGKCKIIINDECYVNRTPEEVEQTIKNVSAIIYESARKQANDKSAS